LHAKECLADGFYWKLTEIVAKRDILGLGSVEDFEGQQELVVRNS